MDLGPYILLPDELIDRIVDCAHAGKLTSVQDNRDQTQWTWADRHSNVILLLIVQHCTPLPEEVIGPTDNNRPLEMPAHVTLADLTASIQQGVRKCSACRGHGHNRESLCALSVHPLTCTPGKNKSCPMFGKPATPSRIKGPVGNSENIPPPF